MNRFWRINTIWRKELIDTLRDRRTLVAMVLVPIILYPALLLGSMQALEVQVSNLVQERYTIGVENVETGQWLQRLIDLDQAQRAYRFQPEDTTSPDPFDDSEGEENANGNARRGDRAMSAAKKDVRQTPPTYLVAPMSDVPAAVLSEQAHVGVLLAGPPPAPGWSGSLPVRLLFDETNIRSEIAAAGVEGILTRTSERMLFERLSERSIEPELLHPFAIEPYNVAPSQRMTGAVLGQILPLILIVMTLTGAIYPAIDLTAGERERGTLETLMVAPTPTSDLIIGKFIVVTLIGLLSAALNLLSIGGTIYLGGLGSILTPEGGVMLPLQALPWIFLLLVPMAVLFSAALLAVCSFARSFKEAQNYIVPVMLAAMIPGVVGALPGTRLEGPLMIMPVANIVVLARELLLERFDFAGIAIVFLSTTLYAAAAVAIATRLFGQEAVLFADSGSIRTLFLRRFFPRRPAPTAPMALLLVALVYSVNFFLQNSLMSAGLRGEQFMWGVIAVMVALFGLLPLAACLYMKVELPTTFHLGRLPATGLLAAVCFGLSTWILVRLWMIYQQTWLQMSPEIVRAAEQQFSWIYQASPLLVLLLLAAMPALCEELFYRGFALSGLRTAVGPWTAIAIIALAFALTHFSIHRFIVTAALGVVLGLLVVRFGSLWPAIIAHFMHNGLTVMSVHPNGLKPLMEQWHYVDMDSAPPVAFSFVAIVLFLVGLLICLAQRPKGVRPVHSDADSSALDRVSASRSSFVNSV